MANLFASRLVGLEKHYESIVANLETIQRCAHNITRHEDYKDLPRSLVAFKTEGNDSTSISADIFCLLSQSYAEYHAYADEYFELAPRNKHIATLAAIRTISQRFYALVDESVLCEVDTLARLWFFQIWENSANGFDAAFKEGDDYCYDLGVLKHLEYVAEHTIDMLNTYFGYMTGATKT